jgi:hypothetical protein
MDQASNADGSDPAAIEVGEADDKLPLWLRWLIIDREAVRHGEALLGAQHNNLAAMEARASSILSEAFRPSSRLER